MPFRNLQYHRCPRCVDIALNELHSFGVRRHHCRGCYGMWLNGEEAIRQFQAHGLTSYHCVFEVAPTTDKLRCPDGGCSRIMRSLLVNGDVELDFCVYHGFWFDQGELSETLVAAKEAKAEGAPIDHDPGEELRAMLQLPANTTGERCGICASSTEDHCVMCTSRVCIAHLIADICARCDDSI